ncbi:MAG: aspartate kinase [Candidatus Methanoperedens sp.]|nr:aspartate kinase [Candidatus Methanoperedens sp.]
MRLVMKFGGTSVGDGSRIKHVAELAKEYRDSGNEVVLVTSALNGVTDALLKNAKEASETGKTSTIKEFITDLTEQHHQAALDAITGKKAKRIVEVVTKELDSRIEELEKALIGICYLGELTVRSIDYISSYGERLTAPILCGSLNSLGIKSRSFTGGEAGIITTDDYGNARPLEKSYSLILERIEPLLKESIPVITGFIGESEAGIITTLGRGGSDFSASIIGAALKADEIWLWKEVHGILTTDPMIVPEARTIPVISYIEAMELSYFGAKVLHPRTIEPAIKHGIPVRVKNTFDPSSPGTIIVKDLKQSKDIVKAVTVIRNVALINISGAGMVGTIGVAARVFTTLANAGVNIIMISQGSSEANISLVVDESHLDKAVKGIKAEFKNGIIKDVTHDKNISVVAVVGAGMANTPGVAGRVFGALGKARVNVIIISQGSSQHNISFAVSDSDAGKAVQMLHKEFGLEKEP